MNRPDDKIRAMDQLLRDEAWGFLCERIDKEILMMEAEISASLKKRNYDMASHMNGKKDMALWCKTLPQRIRRENQSIMERIKEMIDASAG